jgi:ABC-type microcin C transport system duplicated ATPase subunit YejF
VRGNRIAMIFQEPMVSLNPLHTLEKQLYEVLSLHRGMRKEAARGRSSTVWNASGSAMRRGGWRTIRISFPAANASA